MSVRVSVKDSTSPMRNFRSPVSTFWRNDSTRSSSALKITTIPCRNDFDVSIFAMLNAYLTSWFNRLHVVLWVSCSWLTQLRSAFEASWVIPVTISASTNNGKPLLRIVRSKCDSYKPLHFLSGVIKKLITPVHLWFLVERCFDLILIGEHGELFLKIISKIILKFYPQ